MARRIIGMGIIWIICSSAAYATERWDVFELALEGPKVDNPFTEVSISAIFKYKNYTYFVEGFYDGNQTYKIRFMPEFEGEWTYVTDSNREQLDGKSGSFKCTPAQANNHGPVRVSSTFHFAYADETPFYVLGTTAYAWVHQPDALIRETLETLSQESFNKVRMTVMPKQYATYIQNEPPYIPFEGSKTKGWDYQRFQVEFFQHFEKQVAALRDLGVEADVILFHPYDWGKWGFNEGSVEDNILYLRYIIARLAAYRNVWWSMANEYDIMNKSDSEWETYFKTLLTYDPYRHLTSIHNGKGWYNHARPWITHLSVQTPYLEHIQDWRENYQKPVINDEFVYEGNIPYDWGNLTPEETVNRFWTIFCRGGYASHGETYLHPDNILWWSKGGRLYGKSPERLRFFYRIMHETPVHRTVPFHNEWNKQTYLYTPNEDFYLHYFGNSQQAAARLDLPDSREFKITVIDAWNMTSETLGGTYSGKTSIELPQRPYMAIKAEALH